MQRRGTLKSEFYEILKHAKLFIYLLLFFPQVYSEICMGAKAMQVPLLRLSSCPWPIFNNGT